MAIIEGTSLSEILLSQLKNGNASSLDWSFRKDDADYVLKRDDFALFVEQLYQDLINFQKGRGDDPLTVVQFISFGIPGKERITKREFRELFNQIKQKFDDDLLSTHIPLLKGIPDFPEIDTSAITSEDDGAAKYWLNTVIPYFREYAKNNRSSTAGQTEDEVGGQTSASDSTPQQTQRQPDGAVVPRAGIVASSSYTEVQPGQEEATTETPTESQQAPQQTTTSPFQAQKEVYKLAFFGSSLFLESFLEAELGSNWRQIYNSLPTEQKVLLDFNIAEAESHLVAHIAERLEIDQDFKEQLSLAIASGRKGLSVQQIEGLELNIYAIVKQTTENGFLSPYTDRLKIGLGVELETAENFRGSEVIAQVTTQKISDELEKEDSQKLSYSELGKKAFKKQLEQMVVSERYTSPQEIERIGNDLLKRFPHLRGLGIESIDPIDLEQFVGIPLSGNLNASFNFDADIRQKIINSLDEFIKKSSKEERSGAIQDIASYDKYEKFKRENPKESLLSILKEYNHDGVSGDNILNTLDGYVLSLGSAQLLTDQLGGFLDGISPDLKDDPEVVQILQLYVIQRKETLAKYTKNNFLTYSLAPNEVAQIPLDPVAMNTALRKSAIHFPLEADLPVALAFFDKTLFEDVEGETNRQQIIRELAREIRIDYMNKVETMSDQEKASYAQSLNMVDDRFYTVDKDGQRILTDEGQIEFMNQFEQAQPWNAPEINPGDPRSKARFSGWMDKFKATGRLRGDVFRRAAGTLTKEALKKAAPALLGGAAAGAAAYSFLNSVLGLGQTVATLGGFTAAGAAGGALLGFGIPGAIIGGLAGFVVGGIVTIAGALNGGGSTAAAVQTTVMNSARPMAASAANSAKIGADIAARTIVTSEATIPPVLTYTAVSAPLVGVYLFSTMSIAMIFYAFLPDASTVQVAPYFSTDIVESQYISVRKIPNPNSAATPQAISYSLEIRLKPDVEEQITITEITDTMSAIDQNMGVITPPTLPTEATDALAQQRGVVLQPDVPLTISFTVADAADARFNNSLVRNDIKVKFTANDSVEEANGRAQTCFGDCPQSVLGACWPTLGSVWQPPCATGTLSNPTYNPNATYSHTPPRAGRCLDAYDVGASIGTPVFAMSPGTVTYADWDPVSVGGAEAGYGQIIKIDHGGFFTFYAHLSRFGILDGREIEAGMNIEGGDLIGYVGDNGFSSGPHLHFEAFGLQDYIMQDLLQISGKSVPAPGPRCDEYYGRSQ